MAKPDAPLQSVVTAPNAAAIYEDLLCRGLSKGEAANTVASLFGLQVSVMGNVIQWTIADVTRLLFLAHMVAKEADGAR